MLEDTLRRAFKLAHQRIGLIFLDVLWKGIWAVLTTVALFFAVLWITSDLRAIAWEDRGGPALNGVFVVAVLREFLMTRWAQILLAAGCVVVFSVFAWWVLEAIFRRRLTSAAPFHVLVVSNAAKSVLLGGTMLLLIPAAMAGATIISAVTFFAFAFFLTLLDSLIRADAVDLLGTDLFRVAGLVGILVSFEAMLAASVLVILFVGFLNVAGTVDALVMLGAALIGILLLTVLHSYLLLVRFAAIAIMRKNVVEV